MDDLDRLYRRLVQNIRTVRPEYLHIPFTVQELYEQLVPYRHNRKELGIETNQDYETAVAWLLAGERGYLRTDNALRDALLAALDSPTGDPGVFKEFAQVQISLTSTPATGATPQPSVTPLSVPQHTSSTTASSTPAGSASSEPEPSAAESATAAYDALAPGVTEPSAAQPAAAASILSSLSRADIPTGCRFCGGTLPDDRNVNYCPHCGENLKTKRCPACGAEMDTAWRFCVTCGRRAS
jgi:hypothetical protein